MNNARIRRSRKDAEHPYTMIDRDLAQDERLTFEARGIMLYLLSRPDNWELQVNDLVNASPGGRDRTYRIINELVGFGYLEEIRQRTSKGRYSTREIIIHETPIESENQDVDTLEDAGRSEEKPDTAFQDTERQDTERQDTERQDTEKPDHNNIDSTNNRFTKNRSLQNKDNNNAQPSQSTDDSNPPQHPVVVVLLSHGVSRSIALELFLKHEEDYLLEKISFLESELKHNPNLNSPAGWLRKAIEDDYTAPSGYQSEKRTQERAEKNHSEIQEHLQESKHQSQMKEQQDLEQAKQEAQRIANDANHYGISETIIRDWERSRADALSSVSSQVIIDDVNKTVLLSLDGGHATIGVRCQQSLKRLTTRGKRILNSAVLFTLSNGDTKPTHKISHELILIEEAPL